MEAQDTSIEAYNEIVPKAPNLREQVLDYIKQCPDGATDQEIQYHLGLGPQTESPRRRELVKGGFIVDSGERRPTIAGRKAIVWKAV